MATFTMHLRAYFLAHHKLSRHINSFFSFFFFSFFFFSILFFFFSFSKILLLLYVLRPLIPFFLQVFLLPHTRCLFLDGLFLDWSKNQ